MHERFVKYLRASSVHAKIALFALTLIAGGLIVVGDAKAQKALSESGAWSAFTYKEGGNLTCYMYSQPIKKEGNYKKRGNPHAMVTRRQSSGVVEEVSITSGYPYKDKTPIKVKIDGRSFKFGIVQEEHAWADDASEEKKIVKAMIKGNKLTVRGTSRKDTYSLDSYSLKGFSKTHKAIKKACP